MTFHVQVQWADLIISKTRVVSIFTQKMNNWMLNIALLVETALAVVIIYVPVIPQYIGIYPLYPSWWIPALPFSILIFSLDELRRCAIRNVSKHSFFKFIKDETYY